MRIHGHFLHDGTAAFDPGDLDMATLDGFLYGWRAEDLALADGDPVTAWTDVAGMYTMVPRASNPAYQAASALNGLPAVMCTTSPNTGMSAGMAPVADLFGAQGLTIYSVTQAGTNNTTTYRTISAAYNVGSAGSQFFALSRRERGDLWRLIIQAGGGATTAASATTEPRAPENATTTIAAARWDGVSGEIGIRTNGYDLAMSSYTPRVGAMRLTNGNAHLAIGATMTPTINDVPYDGPVAEVWIYREHHDSATVATVEAFLAAKYGITLS